MTDGPVLCRLDSYLGQEKEFGENDLDEEEAIVTEAHQKFLFHRQKNHNRGYTQSQHQHCVVLIGIMTIDAIHAVQLTAVTRWR